MSFWITLALYKEHDVTLSEDTHTTEMFQHIILGRSRIMDLNYTFSNYKIKQVCPSNVTFNTINKLSPSIFCLCLAKFFIFSLLSFWCMNISLYVIQEVVTSLSHAHHVCSPCSSCGWHTYVYMSCGYHMHTHVCVTHACVCVTLHIMWV